MKKLFLIITVFATSFIANAQDYLTRNASISFFSHTPLEDIKAQNNEGVSTLNTATGDIEFKVAIKSFHFPKTAMEEHFNKSDYMDSQNFPKAGFSGKITNPTAVTFTRDGTYTVNVKGELTIKNTTKNITAPVTITVASGKITAQSTFKVNRKDYGIIGESFVQKKIAEEIEITVNARYDKR